MYLKKIEIQGFKSFAKKTVLEFNPGIISVVGPNGSGKSNFSDAIRWVLGEQSMKAVRSKKSEDVIFAGSDKKARLGMAEVNIVFDNADRRLPVDFSEVSVSRRLFRDGESEYLLNGRGVRLMDVVELLSKSGYGNSSYQVISQGTIDQLVLAGPSAIKTLIEEAVGIKPYYLKRDRSVRKLDRTEQNLLRVADLIAEIEPRLRSLRRQAKRMQARDELLSELKNLQQKYFSAEFHRFNKNLQEREEKVGYFNKEITVLSEELGSLEKEIKSLEHSVAGKSGEYQLLQEDLRRVEREKNQLQEQLVIARGQLKLKIPSATDQKSLLLQEQNLKNRLKSVHGILEDLDSQIILSEKNNDQHKKIYESLNRELEKLRFQIDSFRNPFNLSKLQNEVEKLYSKFQSLLYQIKNLHSDEDFDLLRQDASNLEIVLVKLKDRVLQASSTQLNQSALNQLNSELQKVFAKRERIQKELAMIEAQIQTGLSKKQFYKEISFTLEDELKQLEEELKKSKITDPGQQWKDLIDSEGKLVEKLNRYLKDIEKMEKDLKDFLIQETVQKQQLLEKERALREKQDTLSKLKDEKSLVLIEKARDDAILENLFSEIRKNLGNEYTEKIKNSINGPVEAGLEQKITKLSLQVEQVGGVDELTIQEFQETQARYNHLTSQSADLKKATSDLRKVIAELDGLIKKEFNAGFEKINNHFGEYFRILFSGGRARMSLIKENFSLEISDEEDKVEDQEVEAADENLQAQNTPSAHSGREEVSGIEIRATPPGKKLALLSALSGGERTMTAIALLMAILNSFPSPFVVLDEVDAALDEANSVRFGKILSKLAHQTQFITITHNRETMRQASVLYGVTMGDDGISKVLSIKLDKAVEQAS